MMGCTGKTKPLSDNANSNKSKNGISTISNVKLDAASVNSSSINAVIKGSENGNTQNYTYESIRG